VVSRSQLHELGFTRAAIDHRVATGRLHRIHRGVFAVGTPEIGQRGRWMAAVLACGPGAVVSHQSAAEVWGIRPRRGGSIQVTVPTHRSKPIRGVVKRRRELGPDDRATRDGIPVTSPIRTLVDLAVRLPDTQLEVAVNEADKRDLVDPERLREALEGMKRQRGAPALRRLLDRGTFTLTDSELERRFLRLVRDAALPTPQTGVRLNGFLVDFYWPELGLVVETDGLRYHRTPAQQARDRLRDQAHTAAGLTPLRFTNAQIRFEPGRVRQTLSRVIRRLQRAPPPSPAVR
jgi:very-short-patch-repair endonuclease